MHGNIMTDLGEWPAAEGQGLSGKEIPEVSGGETMTLYDLRKIIMSLDERSEIYHIRAALIMVLEYLDEKEVEG